MLLAILGKLKDRELSNVLSKAGFRSAEAEAALGFEEEAFEAQKELVGPQNERSCRCVSHLLEKMPLDRIAYLMAESNNSAALSKNSRLSEQMAPDSHRSSGGGHRARSPWHASRTQVRCRRRAGPLPCNSPGAERLRKSGVKNPAQTEWHQRAAEKRKKKKKKAGKGR